jgi:hypothetical protein
MANRSSRASAKNLSCRSKGIRVQPKEEDRMRWLRLMFFEFRGFGVAKGEFGIVAGVQTEGSGVVGVHVVYDSGFHGVGGGRGCLF